MAANKRKRAASGGKSSPTKIPSQPEEVSNEVEIKLEEKKDAVDHKESVPKSSGAKKGQKVTEKKGKKRKLQEVDSEKGKGDGDVKKVDADVNVEESSSTNKKPSKKKQKDKGEPVPRPLKYEVLGEGPPPVPSTGKMYVGCHVSAAGGIWHAFDNAEECEAKSFGVFLRNQRQWLAKPLEDVAIEKWQERVKDMPPHLVLPHGSYLMNLGSPEPETLEKGRGMLLEEIQRCEKLGIPHYNFHPGSTVGKITREECCKKIAEIINQVCDQTKGVIFVLENMSCQGYTVGGDFHELRTIIEHVKDKARVGVCLDTCHAHAAGYDLGTEAGYQEMIEDFGKIVGWQFLRALHINDSKGKAGDHLDRHENIGRGTIGKEGFRRIMNCKHFQDIPIVLETPWTDNKGYAAEIKILEKLIEM